VVDLQGHIFETVQGLRADFLETSDREKRVRLAVAISVLAKSWSVLQDDKREILGRPKVGTRKPGKEPKRKRRSAPIITGPLGPDKPHQRGDATAEPEKSTPTGSQPLMRQ
jgi:hypothetical protein